MDILSIKENSHSCSHLLLKIHKLGRDYCSGDCVTLSPPLPPESLGLPFLGKLSISCAKHTLFLLWPRSNRSAPKSLWRQKLKIILRAMHALCACIPLALSEIPCGIACSRVLAELSLVCSALWHRC